MSIVYRITCNTTGRIYFGWTTYSLEERFSKHRRNYRRGYYIARCIQKYGAENFTAETLFEFGTNDEAIAKEIELIALWKTNIVRYPDGNGMNMTDGGEGTEGFRHSSVTREIIRKTSTGRKRSEQTQALINKLIEERGSYWNQGRKASLETRKKQSESLKKAYATGIRQPRHDKHSEATKLKMSAAHKGKTFSEETKKKMSEARRGKRLCEGTRQKLRLANVGKKQSPETVEKRVSKIRGKKLRKRTPEEKARVREHFRNYFKTHPHPLLGKKMSPESRAKMRASRLAFLATQREKADD
jgi:group I intron endonuclease